MSGHRMGGCSAKSSFGQNKVNTKVFRGESRGSKGGGQRSGEWRLANSTQARGEWPFVFTMLTTASR
jgi:hypothetical protein